MKLHYVFPNNISFNRSNGFTERTLFDVNCCLPTKNHSTCFYSKTSILIQPLRLRVSHGFNTLWNMLIQNYLYHAPLYASKTNQNRLLGYPNFKKKILCMTEANKLMVIFFTVYYCNVANMKSTLCELRPWKSFSPHSLNAR